MHPGTLLILSRLTGLCGSATVDRTIHAVYDIWTRNIPCFGPHIVYFHCSSTRLFAPKDVAYLRSASLVAPRSVNILTASVQTNVSGSSYGPSFPDAFSATTWCDCGGPEADSM